MLFFSIFVFSIQFIIQLIVNKIWPMTEFELLISSFGSNRYTNWATTSAQVGWFYHFKTSFEERTRYSKSEIFEVAFLLIKQYAFKLHRKKEIDVSNQSDGSIDPTESQIFANKIFQEWENLLWEKCTRVFPEYEASKNNFESKFPLFVFVRRRCFEFWTGFYKVATIRYTEAVR